MKRRLLVSMAVAMVAAALTALPAVAGSGPTGERLHGRTNGNGGQVIEPAINDANGSIVYLSTPRGVANPVRSNPRAAAPIYLPVYPASSTVTATLNCQHVPTENCPDHGGAVATAASAIMPGVYPNTDGNTLFPDGSGVIGHDHLLAVPGGHGDFNIAWVPTLVLFTNSAAANTHITTLQQINDMVTSHDVILVPLDGTNGTPNATFHCSVVPASVWDNTVPFLG